MPTYANGAYFILKFVGNLVHSVRKAMYLQPITLGTTLPLISLLCRLGSVRPSNRILYWLYCSLSRQYLTRIPQAIWPRLQTGESLAWVSYYLLRDFYTSNSDVVLSMVTIIVKTEQIQNLLELFSPNSRPSMFLQSHTSAIWPRNVICR